MMRTIDVRGALVSRFALLLCLAQPIAIAGCGPQGEPKSDTAAVADLATLVADLERQTGEIQTAMTSGNAEAADEPLHTVGRTLIAIPKAAKAEGIDGDGLQQIESSVQALLAAFGEIHDGMHGGTATTAYEEVADSIQKGLEQIKAAIAK